jgi:DNA-binding transcriptional LysR family regulator
MDLRRLRYFAAVAEEGGFHRASERLNVAQPALSRQIRDLEQELDVVLFVRSSKGVRLSPAGEVLLREVRRLLPEIEQAKTRTQRAAMGQFGMLRVGFTTVAAELPFAMRAFAEARRVMPEVEYRLTLVNSDDQADALDRGEIDLGVLYRRPPHPPEFAYRDLRTDRYSLLVPSDHRLTKQERVLLADLRGEDMILGSPAARPISYAEILNACRAAGLNPRKVLEVDSESIVMNMVAAGVAISFWNSALAENRRVEGVTCLSVDDLDVELQLAAMWHRSRETPAVLRFVDLLCRHLALSREAEDPGRKNQHKIRNGEDA